MICIKRAKKTGLHEANMLLVISSHSSFDNQRLITGALFMPGKLASFVKVVSFAGAAAVSGLKL